LIDTLRCVGVDTAGVIVDPNVFTTLAFVTLDKTGNRSFDFARKPGARDIFGGSAVAQLLHLQKSIEALTKDDLERIGKFATAAAGLSTLQMSGITSIPSMAEVMEQLSRM